MSGDINPTCESPLLPLRSASPEAEDPSSARPPSQPALSSSHICLVTYCPSISCLHSLVTNLEHPSFMPILPLFLLIPRALPLGTGAKLDRRDRVLGEVEKNSFTRQRGTHGLLP